MNRNIESYEIGDLWIPDLINTNKSDLVFAIFDGISWFYDIEQLTEKYGHAFIRVDHTKLWNIFLEDERGPVMKIKLTNGLWFIDQRVETSTSYSNKLPIIFMSLQSNKILAFIQ